MMFSFNHERKQIISLKLSNTKKTQMFWLGSKTKMLHRRCCLS